MKLDTAAAAGIVLWQRDLSCAQAVYIGTSFYIYKYADQKFYNRNRKSPSAKPETIKTFIDRES